MQLFRCSSLPREIPLGLWRSKKGCMNSPQFQSADGGPAHCDRRLRILILGGTGFIGPWMAELAVLRGHPVTLFNRGRRERLVGSTVGTETLYGNRDPRLHAETVIVDGEEVDDE